MSGTTTVRALAAALVVVAVGTASAAAEGSPSRSSRYWVVVVSDRDGEARGYSVRPDGTGLTPLLPASRTLAPTAMSRDGSTLAYEDFFEQYGGGIFVSRANGTALRPLVRDGSVGVLSPNGKLVAFKYGDLTHVAIVGIDGSGRRDVSSDARDEIAGWSPDGRALLLVRSFDGPRAVLAIQRLTGSRREIASGLGLGRAAWSPRGAWIAYETSYGESARNGLYVARPDGTRRHRLARGWISWFSWSPNGRALAVRVSTSPNVEVIDLDGRRLRRLRSPRATPTWSPEGRLVTIAPRAAGEFGVLGWTRLAPVRAPAGPLLPSERVVDARTVATRRPVTDLSADGPRVAFAVATRTAVDCDHVVVWTPATRGLRRFGRPRRCEPYNNAGEIYDVELAGLRAAWASYESCGNHCDVSLASATLAAPRPLTLSYLTGAVGSSDDPFEYHVRGHGDLLVFNDGERLVRIGGGRGQCTERSEFRPAKICTRIRGGAHACCADGVARGLIAVREPDAVDVLDAQGALVRAFPFGRGQVSAARLDGGRLVVARPRVLEVYDVQTGGGELQRTLPSGFRLIDIDGRIAVLRDGVTLMLVRLADGRSLTLKPGLEPVSAELEPAGLYYAYALPDRTGRAVFVPRAEIVRRLEGSGQ